MTLATPTIQPLFRYFGSKWTLSKYYPEPEYDTIVEPFAGSAGYSIRYHDRNIILVEKDPIVYGIWNWLIGTTEEEIRALPLIIPGEKIPDSVQGPARDFMGFWCTITGAKPQYKLVPSAKSIPASFWNPLVRERTAKALKYIRHWKVINGNYDSVPDIGYATWFVDPPYQPPKDRKTSQNYPAGIPDFDKLATYLKTVPKGQVIVCENSGADWLPFEPFRVGHSAPRKQRISQGKGCTTEEVMAMWRNYVETQDKM